MAGWLRTAAPSAAREATLAALSKPQIAATEPFAEELDPSLAFGIAVYGFIEGAKAVPGPAAA